jgi:hypothetical protein
MVEYIDMSQLDDRLMPNYNFDGEFFEIKNTSTGDLINRKPTKVSILKTKCDIQQASQLGNSGFLANTYNIYFPLEENVDATDWIDRFKDVSVIRSVYFEGKIYGYEVNGKVIGVGPSLLGGCVVQIKDTDE